MLDRRWLGMVLMVVGFFAAGDLAEVHGAEDASLKTSFVIDDAAIDVS